MKVFTEPVGEHAAPLTCYVQDGSDELATAAVRPGVLVLPGGGYAFTSDREAEPVALAYLAEGFNAFVLRYATGPDAPWERSFDDARAGLAWIRDHAADLAVDPDRIAAVGFSAGGHLAAALGTLADTKPDALVLGYPVTLGEFGPGMGKELPDVAAAVSAATPPTFVFHTAGDELVPVRNSLALLSALAAHEVPFESHLYALGPHGISLAKALTANGLAAKVDEGVARWLPDSVRFLRMALGDFDVDDQPWTYATWARRRAIGTGTRVGRLLADPRAAAVLEEHLPGFTGRVQGNGFALSLPLDNLARREPRLVPAETLALVARDLEALDEH